MARIINTAEFKDGDKLTKNLNDWVYNGLDVCVTIELVHVLLEQLDDTTRATYDFTKALQAPVLEMSLRGLRVDKNKKAEVLKEIKSTIEQVSGQLTEIIREGIGVELNWRSPTQLKHLFYNILGLKPIRSRNAAGIYTPTVDLEALEKLSQYMIAEPICLHLMLLRDLDKQRQFLETGIDPDGRMRASFNLAGTNSGRLASSMSALGTGTNLQNVSRKLRSVFIADPGMKFGNCDLEQADARNVAAKCWNLFYASHGEKFAGSYLDACESGDLHTSTCMLAWTNFAWTDDKKANRKIADQIAYRQDSYRQLAKKLGHGTNYYGQPRTMAAHTKMEIGPIEDFQRRYFKGYPCIREWHNWVRKQLETVGFIETLFKRRRYFFGRPNEDSTLREAISFDPQSSTAEEINHGMLKLHRTGKVQLLVQVHDSILFQFKEEREEEIMELALDCLKVPLLLEGGREFTVPVDGKTGWNWGDVDYNDDGSVKDNQDGLAKWKNKDARKRTTGLPLSVAALL